MQITLPAPTEEIDLSLETEQEIVQKARISAQIAGYKSVRHFTIAAMLAIIEKIPLPERESPKPKK